MAFLNLDLDFFAHPKCARLVGLIGRDSEVFPLRLWAYTAKYHSVDGKLSGYSPQAVERIVQWGGQPGQCVDALAAVGFIDKIGESDWKVHDWVDYQGHIHALKLRNKKVAKNRWKNMRKLCSTVDTSGIPKSTSGVPQSFPFQSFPEDSKEKERKPPDKPPADRPLGAPNPKVNVTEPPKKPYGQPKTDVQKVVSGFKAVMNVPDSDREWDAVYFRRYSRPAADLLRLCGGDVLVVADCIDQVSAAMEKKGLSWTPETIVKHAGDWKNGRLFK